MAARWIKRIIKTIAALFAVVFVIAFTNSIFGGWWDNLMLGFREVIVDTKGVDSAMSAAHESKDYFRRHGERVDFLFEDIDMVSLKTREIDVYWIEVWEQFIGKSTLRRLVVFDQNQNVIKVEITSHGEGVDWTAEIELLPFGTYYIITESGENYILTERDGQKSAVRASDATALYDKLMSYGIERLIDYDAFKQDGISCYEAARVREYSTLSSTAYFPGIYLREYQSRPGAYYMETNDGYRHIIEAYFHYSKVNSTAPRLGDYH
jgi:hypothetical protein